MAVVDFKTSGYFSWLIIFLGAVLGLVGLFVVGIHPVMGGVLLLTCVIITTTHYRLTIDLDRKVFHDYVWILWVKNGDWENFETLECLFITKSRVRQTMNHLAGSSTIQKEVYNGYLKFSGNDKIHLLTHDRRAGLIKKLRIISAKLKIRIIDYSDGEPREI